MVINAGIDLNEESYQYSWILLLLYLVFLRLGFD
jgi:hypothetical protein